MAEREGAILPRPSVRGISKAARSSGGVTLELYSEEDVKFKFLVPYLERYGYKKECIRFNVSVEVQEGRKVKTIFADAVVYSSAKSDTALVLCETKGPNEVLDKAARGQAISYARLLPRIAPLTLLTNGSQVQVFQTVTRSRIPALLPRKELGQDLVNSVLGRDLQEGLRREAKHELFIIDDVQTFKRLLRSAHNEVRNNEGHDPTVAFDELSKLLFCKMYEERSHPDNNRFRGALYDETMSRAGVNVVRKIFEEARQDSTFGSLFASDAEIHLQDRTIRTIVGLFESFDLSLTAFDVKGEAFEYFLGDTFTGGLGEYFTPRNIVEFMVDAWDPKIGERLIDPFSGTGGFLIYAFDVVSQKIRLQDFSDAEKLRWKTELSNRSLYGTDWKERTSLACKMNMVVHGDGSAGVLKANGLRDVPGVIEAGTFDLCLTNPPFGAKETDAGILTEYELGSGRDSQDRLVLAVERAIRLVTPGGRVGIVVIDGLLDNASQQTTRDFILRQCYVKAVISLNPETFQGYGARAKTSILFLERKDVPDDGQQKATFMALVANTGYSPTGEQIPGNQLPEVLLDWKAFLQGELTPETRHAETWVVPSIGLRLDAKFYSQKTSTASLAFDDTRQELVSRLSVSQAGLSAISSLLHAASDQEPAFRTVVLGDLLEETSERSALDAETVYRVLGVRWHGAGTFVREEKRGKDIKGAALYRVRPGELIYNRLFAFRGSFTIVPEEHDGAFVSSEFPTFKVKSEPTHSVVLLRYIVHTLNSPQYLARVDALSTGSTKQSRNRFNQRLFVALSIAVPIDAAVMATLVELIDEAAEIRAQQEVALELAKAIREDVGRLLPSPP